MKRVVEFNRIHRGYQRDVDVLDGVSFGIDAGQIVGLLGKNGAGKTTLMRIAMGMIGTRQGSVRLFGLDPRVDAVAVKRRVGYVSEDQILPPFLRVGAVIDLHRQLFAETWDEGMAERLVARFSLPLASKIKHLSKGQARQVALLCAVSHRPELLLLDEPAGGLDPAARREFLETSIHLLNETGSTILFSSHHMSDVERMADRVVLLHEGKVLIDSELDLLREQHCLAMIPGNGNGEQRRQRLLGLDTCLGVRERPGALHAIIRLEPEQAAAVLTAEFGTSDIRCTRLGLEEMFIELVGGQS